MSVVKRRLVNAALKAMLVEATSRPFGILRAPETSDGKQESFPYGVIIPRPKGALTGPPYSNSPWADASLEYHIKSIGERDDQCEALADKIRDAIIGRDSTGEYNYDLVIGENHVVMERRPSVISPGDSSPQGKIFEVDDGFVIVVTTS